MSSKSTTLEDNKMVDRDCKVEEDALNKLYDNVEKLRDNYDQKKNDPNNETLFSELSALLFFLKDKVNNCKILESLIKEQESEMQIIKDQAVTSKKMCDESNDMKADLMKAIARCKEHEIFFQKSEAVKKEEAKALREENEEFSGQLKLGSGWTIEQKTELEELLASIEKKKLAIDKAKVVLEEKRTELWKNEERIEREEEKVAALAAEENTIENEISKLYEETHGQIRKKNALVEEIEQAQTDVKLKHLCLEEKELALQSEYENEKNAEIGLREKKNTMELHVKEYEELHRESQQVTLKNEKQFCANKELNDKTGDLEENLRGKKIEIKSAAKNLATIKKKIEIMVRKNKDAELEKIEAEKRRDEIKIMLRNIEGIETLQARNELEISKKQEVELQREIDLLSRRIDLSQKGTCDVTDLMKVNENKLKNTKNELLAIIGKVQTHKETIDKLNKEHKKLEHETLVVREKQNRAGQHLMSTVREITYLERKSFEFESRLKQQQKVYGILQEERNSQSEQLIEVQQQVDVKTRNLELTDNEIRHVHQEISNAEKALIRESYGNRCVDFEKKSLGAENERLRKKCIDMQNALITKEYETQKLVELVKDTEKSLLSKQSHYESTIRERDAVNLKLVRINKEVKHLEKDVKLQISKINRQDLYYQSKISEIDVLAGDCRAVAKQRKELEIKVHDITELSRKIIALESDLVNKKNKNRALVDELGLPMNVHKMRHLEHSDPVRYETVRTLHRLQKRVISTSDEISKKDAFIHELENQYLELKCSIDRVAPNSKIQKQIEHYRLTYGDQKKQLKALNEELNFFKQRTKVLEDEINRVEGEKKKLSMEWILKKVKELNISD